MVTTEVTNSADIIDSRDVIERIKQLKKAKREEKEEFADQEELDSLKKLDKNGRDIWSQDNWQFGITLVRDDYFEDFARDEAEGFISDFNELQWPFTCIDWEDAAEQLQQDYTEVDFDGVTYWGRE